MNIMPASSLPDYMLAQTDDKVGIKVLEQGINTKRICPSSF